MARDDSWIDAEVERAVLGRATWTSSGGLIEWECMTCMESYGPVEVPVGCARKGHDVRLAALIEYMERDEEHDKRVREVYYWLDVWQERRQGTVGGR